MGSSNRLRRDLGTLESYAALVGILIGAGIFRVTSDAWQLTGSSVIVGYMVLAVPLFIYFPLASSYHARKKWRLFEMLHAPVWRATSTAGPSVEGRR